MTVDARQGVLACSSYSKTIAGFWVMNGWFCVIAEPVDDDILGSTVLEALSKSEHDVPTPPPDGPLPIAPLLEQLGLRTTAQFMTGTRSVVVRTGMHIEIVPKKNEGARGGFSEIEAAVERLKPSASSDPAMIGDAVRSALAVAR